MQYLVIVAHGTDPQTLSIDAIAARLGAAETHLSIVVSDEQMQATLKRLVAEAPSAVPVFWYSLSHRASRQYVVSDIATAATTFGQCRIFHDPAHASVGDAARIAARLLDSDLMSASPEDLSLVYSRTQPSLATADRLTPEDLIEAAAAALAERRPLSFIRVNHCEPRVMGLGDIFTLRDTQLTTRKQWARTDTTEDEMQVVSRLMAKAVRDADIVGIPRFRRMVIGLLAMLERSVYTLEAERGLFPKDVRYVDVMVHGYLASHPGMFELMKSAERLVLIAGRECRELDVVVGRSDIVRLAVPLPETSDTSHYPHRYTEIMSQIPDLVTPGTLVLVGAGILGKIYCGAVKRAGGVALDMGAVLDAWEGLNTRLTYKPEMALSYQLAARQAS